MPARLPARWIAILVVTLSSALNYLDRQILPAVAPDLRSELGLSNADYGLLLAAFSVAYAVGAPAAGWIIDRIGLTWGLAACVVLWSLAGAGSGLAGSFGMLLVMRALLGAGQAGGVPGSLKAVAAYLPARERALGSATTQFGLSAGAIAAPLAASWFSATGNWRWALIATGLAGLLWAPLWLATRRLAPSGAERRPARARWPGKNLAGEQLPRWAEASPNAPRRAGHASQPPSPSAWNVLFDRRLWAMAAASVLYMTMYSLWSNWTTVYLVEDRGLTQDAANRLFAWIPPVCANLGGLAGGWLALRWIGGGTPVSAARLRVCWWSSLALLATAAVPLMPGAVAATVLISLSFFSVTAMSVNVYAMPLDVFGVHRAALAVSVLTCSYGVMQALVSPAIGAVIDRYGFAPVCAAGALLPLLGTLVLERNGRRTAPAAGEPPIEIRPLGPADLAAVERIQAASPQAAQWAPAAYLDHDSRVACRASEVLAFLVIRSTVPDEHEILNIAVAPEARRRGIAEALIRDAQRRLSGRLFLEVRESNAPARLLYRKLGFHEAGRRPGYYSKPDESAIVMAFQSC